MNTPRKEFGLQESNKLLGQSSTLLQRETESQLLVALSVLKQFGTSTAVQPNTTLMLQRNFGPVTSSVIHLECSFVWR
jgi:hypothetical protein